MGWLVGANKICRRTKMFYEEKEKWKKVEKLEKQTIAQINLNKALFPVFFAFFLSSLKCSRGISKCF
jgi:hypothetical protein